MNPLITRAAALAVALILLPSAALACACGCQVFDVGGTPLMAVAKGGEVFVEYDFMDQTRNFAGTHSGPGADNDDKQIRSNFVVAGVQYMFNKDWGVMAELPVTNRYFRTSEGGPDVESFNHTAFGDIRLMGVYTGLSADMSTGLIAGVKLPTGDFKYNGFDRDVAIGSGSTDILLGGYHVGALSKDGAWGYFIQGQFDIPVATQDGYRPGDEFDGALGVSYAAWTSGDGRFRLSPVVQMIGSARVKDSGIEADPDNSGYGRLLISPGVQLDAGNWKIYGDVEFPVYQAVNGNQLVAPELFKVVVSRRF
jgi:hypothetical protein